MTEYVNHPSYGKIVYTESAWTGKKTIMVDGVEAKPISKKEFKLNEKRLVISGSILTGVNLCIDNEKIEISPKPKWYEAVLAIIPFAFILIWGNSVALCSIFPVIGGALGGVLGALGSMLSLLFMKKTSSPIIKLLIGLGVFIVTVLIAFAAASAFISLIA